jgi:Family of unknown function (DUF6011)
VSNYPRTDERYPGWTQLGPAEWVHRTIAGKVSQTITAAEYISLGANQYERHYGDITDQVQRNPDFGFYLINDLIICVTKRAASILFLVFHQETREWKDDQSLRDDIQQAPKATPEQVLKICTRWDFCLICKRPLSNSKSVTRGIGPVCWKNIVMKYAGLALPEAIKLIVNDSPFNEAIREVMELLLLTTPGSPWHNATHEVGIQSMP